MSVVTAHRLGLIDIIKAVASNLIVLHHLAFYGPMSDFAAPLLPDLFDWLATDARIAVQAFLVLGGFLAARSLAASRTAVLRQPHWLLLRRYLKLAPPFIVAMALAALASELARAWMDHPSISSPASPLQLAAHALLLHDVFGLEALSAGAWYVAIDFQLYALLLGVLWLTRDRGASLAPVLAVAALAALSLWQLNLDPQWDVWAPYFFGSYGLGVLAWWSCDRGRRGWLIAAAVLALGGIALLVEFRSRIALALAVALLLIVVFRLGLRVPGERSSVMAFLSRTSYAVFLLHFPVCLVVNAAFQRFAPRDAAVQMAGVVLAWVCSLAAGYVFHRRVEVPLGRWGNGLGAAERANRLGRNFS